MWKKIVIMNILPILKIILSFLARDQDRRSQFRYRIAFLFKFRLKGIRPIVVNTLDVSKSGARINSPIPLQVGQLLVIKSNILYAVVKWYDASTKPAGLSFIHNQKSLMFLLPTIISVFLSFKNWSYLIHYSDAFLWLRARPIRVRTESYTPQTHSQPASPLVQLSSPAPPLYCLPL